MTENSNRGDRSLAVEKVLPVRSEWFLVDNGDPLIVLPWKILVRQDRLDLASLT